MLKNLTVQVAIAAVIGIGSALFFSSAGLLTEQNAFYESILLIKSVFLAALRMLIAPLIFFSLLGGIASIGNVIRLKSLGGITIAYYLVTSGFAIALALLVVFFVHPWTAYHP